MPRAVTIRLWQLFALTAAATFALGLLVGRYTFPHKSARVKAVEALLKGASSDPSWSNQEESEAQADVRAAVPAMEAYNADRSLGYSGATIPLLQRTYDAGIRNVELRWANQSSYFLE